MTQDEKDGLLAQILILTGSAEIDTFEVTDAGQVGRYRVAMSGTTKSGTKMVAYSRTIRDGEPGDIAEIIKRWL